MEVSVVYKGIELKLEGDFIQAYSGGRNEESIAETFETYAVFAGETEITDILTEECLAELDTEAINELL